MQCKRCNGRMFIDRVFSENRNYEMFCILCGARLFIHKNSELGKWIHRLETARENALSRVG